MQPVPTTFPISEGIYGHLYGMDYEKAVKKAFKIKFKDIDKGDVEEVSRMFKMWFELDQLDIPNNWDLMMINLMLKNFSGKTRERYTVDERLLFLDIITRANDKSIPLIDRFIYDCLIYDLVRDSS